MVGDTAKTASDFKIISFSTKLFLNKVPPVETMSTIASASPIFGAISTEPLMTWILAVMLLSFKKALTVLGYEVAICLPF